MCRNGRLSLQSVFGLWATLRRHRCIRIADQANQPPSFRTAMIWPGDRRFRSRHFQWLSQNEFHIESFRSVVQQQTFCEFNPRLLLNYEHTTRVAYAISKVQVFNSLKYNYSNKTPGHNNKCKSSTRRNTCFAARKYISRIINRPHTIILNRGTHGHVDFRIKSKNKTGIVGKKLYSRWNFLKIILALNCD